MRSTSTYNLARSLLVLVAIASGCSNGNEDEIAGLRKENAARQEEIEVLQQKLKSSEEAHKKLTESERQLELARRETARLNALSESQSISIRLLEKKIQLMEDEAKSATNVHAGRARDLAWKSERDSFRRKVAGLQGKTRKDTVGARVKELRERAFKQGDYDVAVTLLEECKFLLEDLFEWERDFRRSLGPEFVKPIDDSQLRVIEQELIQIEKKFAGIEEK